MILRNRITNENCRLVIQSKPEYDPARDDGMCDGFVKGDNDDEPCDNCKICSLFAHRPEDINDI